MRCEARRPSPVQSGLKKEVPAAYQTWVRGAQPQLRGAIGIPVRGILIGAVLAFLLNFCDAYALNLIGGSFMTLNHSAPAALFLFFWVLLAGGLVHWLRRPLALGQAELVTIFIMLLVSCCVSGLGFTQYILPSLVGSRYYAMPHNNWDSLYNAHIPTWLIPQGEEVVRYFFEGLPPGEPLPWGAWAAPLAYWYGFFLVLSFVMVCAMVIVRKQWMEHERLAYPLVQVPMEMIHQTDSGMVGRSFFASKIMWVGFVFSFSLLSVQGLHFYHPEIPYLERSGTLALFGLHIPLQFNPTWIGFFYFVHRDVSASIWVFYLLASFQRGLFDAINLRSDQGVDMYSGHPYLAHQCMGAMIAFVLVGLWVGRRHLMAVCRRAVRGDPEVDDEGEMLSYRQALGGMTGGLALVAVGLWMTGLSLLLALMFTFGAMVLFMALSRVVAEGGIPAMRPAILTSSFVIAGAGTATLGASGLVALGLTYGWHAEIRTFIMAAMANGLKLSEAIRGSKRRLIWAVLISVVVSLAGSTYMTMHLSYELGGVNLPFFDHAAQMGPKDLVPRLRAEPGGPHWQAWLFMGIGGTAMSFLMWVRSRFMWWPLSPLGFVIGPNWKTSHLFLSAVIAWALKTLILRYGSVRLYRQLRFFFMGLILGEVVGAGLWLLLDYFTGQTGNNLTNA